MSLLIFSNTEQELTLRMYLLQVARMKLIVIETDRRDVSEAWDVQPNSRITVDGYQEWYRSVTVIRSRNVGRWRGV